METIHSPFSGAKQSAIVWPNKYQPGTADSFVSNEIVAKGVAAMQIWTLLADISKWESTYASLSHVAPPESGPKLEKGDTFKFRLLNFPVLTCSVRASVPPRDRETGRLSWSAQLEDDPDGIDLYDAWLVEDLGGGAVRILTQQTQIGKLASEWKATKPNKLLLGHQNWLDSLVAAAQSGQSGIISFGSV